MKSLGIVRKLDELGRIVLPMELRRTLGIDAKDEIEIYLEGDVICLKPVAKDVKICAICGVTESLYPIDDKYICKTCAVTVLDKLMEN